MTIMNLEQNSTANGTFWPIDGFIGMLKTIVFNKEGTKESSRHEKRMIIALEALEYRGAAYYFVPNTDIKYEGMDIYDNNKKFMWTFDTKNPTASIANFLKNY